MTDNTNYDDDKTVTGADCIRAANSIIFYATGDLEALAATLDPIDADTDRLTATLLAVLQTVHRRYDADDLDELRRIIARMQANPDPDTM